MNMRSSFKPFTIIEVIVVILIALIIISLTAGTIMSAGDGMRLDSSARLVGSVMMRARQEAIAKRRLVAVIMPGQNADIDNEKKYSAIRVAYVTADDSTTPTSYIFADFPDDTKWGYVQPGIAIMEADDDCGILDSLGASQQTRQDPYDDEITLVQDVDLSELGGSAKRGNIRAIIFSSSSRLKADTHRYITVGQANFNAGRWLVKNPASIKNGNGTLVNESCANQMTIEINRFTGGVRYLSVDKYPDPL